MTFEQANSIIKSSFNSELREEAEAAFGIIYEQQPLCSTCVRKLDCGMMNPTVYRCHFWQDKQEAQFEKAIYNSVPAVNI